MSVLDDIKIKMDANGDGKLDKSDLEDLKNRGIDGRDSTISGIKELMKNGYIRRTRKRDKGRFVGYEYEVYEIPNELAIAEYAKSENGKSKVANSNLG